MTIGAAYLGGLNITHFPCVLLVLLMLNLNPADW